METYIHYGNYRFEISKLKETMNNVNKYRRDKPPGFWASPTNSKFNWKFFCERNEWRTERLAKSFTFSLSPHARILEINSLEDAMPHLEVIEESDYVSDYGLKIEQICFNYDAMKVIMSNDFANLHNNNVFNNWDIDSICIWNPYIIIPA